MLKVKLRLESDGGSVSSADDQPSPPNPKEHLDQNQILNQIDILTTGAQGM